jgi:chitodextrinase
MRAHSSVTPVRSRALVTALLLALLAALLPALPVAAQDLDWYDGYVTSSPSTVRPGGTPRVDLTVESWSDEPFFDSGATLEILDWNGVSHGAPPLMVADAYHASFQPPGDLIEGFYWLRLEAGGRYLEAYLSVMPPDGGYYGLFVAEEILGGASGFEVVADPAFLLEDTVVTEARLWDPSVGDERDVVDTTAFVREDDARGRIELGAPLQPGQMLSLTLVGSGGTFYGWLEVPHRDLYLAGDALLEGSTAGEVLRLHAYGFRLSGDETVRLRSYGAPIPRQPLGPPTISPTELTLEVLAQLGVGQYELVVTTSEGPLTVPLRVVPPAVQLWSSTTLLRPDTGIGDLTRVDLYGIGQGWGPGTVVELVDLGGSAVAQAPASVDEWSPTRQYLMAELDLEGVPDGVHRLRVTTGEAVDETIAVRVKGPYVTAELVWLEDDVPAVEVWPRGFDIEEGAAISVRNRDGLQVGYTTVSAEDWPIRVGLGINDDLEHAVHTVTVEQDGRTFTGRFRPYYWWHGLEVSPDWSEPGSRPDELQLRDRGGDLSAQPISITSGFTGGSWRDVPGDLPTRLDRERAVQGYPGGLADGYYEVHLEDDGVHSYGYTVVGDDYGVPHLEAADPELPSGFGPDVLRLFARGFELDADSDITAELSVYDYDLDEEVVLDAIGDIEVVSPTELDVEITIPLPDDHYRLRVDINGALYNVELYVGWGGGRWMYADPSYLPSGADRLDLVAIGFSIPEDAELGAVLRDSSGQIRDVVGSLTRGEDGTTMAVAFTEPLGDDYYELEVSIGSSTYWVDFWVGDGPPRFYVHPYEIAPDTPRTVTLEGVGTSWTPETEVELYVADPWGTDAVPAGDIPITAAGLGADPGDLVEGAILDVHWIDEVTIDVDLDGLEEGLYVFRVTTGDQVLSSHLEVRVPTGLTITPSVVDPRSLPRTLAVEALNLDLREGDAITLWGPQDDEPIEGWFTASSATTGSIAVPAGATPGWYGLQYYKDGRFGWANFRIIATSVSISPSIITDAGSDGRVLAVTARGFSLDEPTVTLQDAAGDPVPTSSTVRWWERLDVTVGQALSPGRYTLTVTEGGTEAQALLEVVAAPPAGTSAPPRATIEPGAPGTVVTDPATGLVTATMGAFEVENVVLDFPIPGCPPGDDIATIGVRLGTQHVDVDYDRDACTGRVFIPAEVITSEGGGTIVVEVEREEGAVERTSIGEIVLYDPAGIVTDAETGEPIEGAVTTLYRAPGLTPATGPTVGAGQCQTSATVSRDPETGKSLWNQFIDLADGLVEPADSAAIEPRPAATPQTAGSKNPLVTTESGYYGWDVAEGCWLVQVTAEGYDDEVSPVVGIGPPPLEDVTDLDIEMTPSEVPPPVDTVPPVWASGAELLASGVTTNQAVLTWPAATDDRPGAVQYQLRRDGTPVTGWITELTAVASGLTHDTSYVFTVVARDAAGNITPVPLQRTVRTLLPPDLSPPIFGDGGLVASGISATALTLTWPVAIDRSLPVTYTVRRGGTVLAEGLTATSYRVTGLSPDTAYTFSVTAKDAVGNVSAPLPLTVRTAEAGTPTPTPPTCADARPGMRFSDVDPRSVHGPNILCSAGLDLVTGRPDGTYDPTGSLTRGQTATILLRALERSGIRLTAQQGFADVPDGYTHAVAIRKLAAAGILNGTSPTTFDPGGAVTRAQFAALLDRTSSRFLAAYPEARNPFTDVAGSVHEPAIRRLAGAGVIRGTTATTFAPGADINRAQAASLFVRWLEDQAGRLR